MPIRNITRGLLPLALTFLYLACKSAPLPNEGYVDAGGGVRLFYRLVGSGNDSVVVLHGGPGFTMEYLAADLEPLAARHVLLFYDQRGTGRSTLVSDSTALDAQSFADDLEAIRRHFGIERLTLLGHSWGSGRAGTLRDATSAACGTTPPRRPDPNDSRATHSCL